MASSTGTSYTSSQETTNFARMCRIVVDVLRDILWQVLIHEIPAGDLPYRVQTNQVKLPNLDLNINSWLCGMSPTEIPIAEKFDVSSLYTLIRNLCVNVPSPTTQWGRTPPAGATKLGDDIERIREFRNTLYGHATKAKINAADFNNRCIEITAVVSRFDIYFSSSCNAIKCDFKRGIDTILTCSMDRTLQDSYIDKMKEIAVLSDDIAMVKQEVAESRKTESSLRKDIETLRVKIDIMEKESLEVKKQWDSLSKERKSLINKMEQQRIIDLSNRILQQHTSYAETTFVETQGYQTASKILKQTKRLVITGKSGQGKTYLAHQLLKETIADDPTIKPLILTTVEQWKTLVDCSITLGIIVEDMCGKYCLNEGELIKWREESTYMRAIVENGKHVILFTMKSFLHEKILVAMQSHPLFPTQIILNLDNIGLKFEEKIEFANTYLREFGLNNVERSDLCKMRETPVGFPQLCRAADMIKEKSKLFNLFSKPREIILKQITHIRNDDIMTYACLALVLLSKGKITIQTIRDFRKYSEMKENIVIVVFNSCGIPDVKPIKVLDTFRSLQGRYLSLDATEESYSFAHDSIEEAVFISYGESFPKETLLYGSLQLICTRCIIKYDSKLLETTSQDNTLLLPPFYQAIMIKRFIAALKEGNPEDFTIVSEANIWSRKDFTKAIFAECEEIHILADKDENTLLVHAANANNRDLVDELLHKLDHIPEDKKTEVVPFIIQSAKASCAHNDIYLLKKICENGRVDVSDILPISIQHGCVEAIEFLLQSGADINYRFKKGENLLHIACLHGRLNIVKLLHSKNGNLVNEFDDDNRSVIHCAAAGGCVEVLEFLLSLGLNPSYTDLTGWNLLHYACWQGKKAMAEHLMNKYSNMLCGETKEGMSLFLCAAFGGNISIFKKLYELMKDSIKLGRNRTNHTAFLMQKTIHQQSLLHMSCLGGCLEMIQYLVETYPQMILEVDTRMSTSAHYAAYGGNVTALIYLISRGTDPWCRTAAEETLLHRACINGQLEMTKYLVQTYPKMLHEVDNSKGTPAHNAAQSGNVTVLSYLIDHGSDPWCRTSTKETLLHSASINGQLKMTKYLVERFPTMLHEVDNRKRTPAHNAAQSGNIAVLSYLIDRGTDPWCRTSRKETLLHNACINGQLDMTKYLVKTYPKMLFEVNKSNKTPAHHAVLSGNVSLLRYLIERGTDPWCRSSKNETLLHKACIKGHLDMTKYLVETYPVLLYEMDESNRTPIHYAAESNNVSVLSYIIKLSTDPWRKTNQQATLLHRACISGQLEMTKIIVETFPTMLYEVDKSKRTPASYAVQSNNVSVLIYLIASGADPWCKSSTNETLLHSACIKGQFEIAKYLVDTYPKMLLEVDNNKSSPAYYAAQSGSISVLRYLIAHGADPWCRNTEKETLLHGACIRGQLEMTKYLVETYPKMLHMKDNTQSTAAYYAAQSNQVSVLSYLIGCGTDSMCRNSENETLLHSACIKSKLKMIKYLVETYPKLLHCLDNRMRTPAHTAAQCDNVSVLKYLINCGTDPWCRTSEKETLLHRACINGQLKITKYLVETYPEMIHDVHKSKTTPAHNAAENGNVSVLIYLIDRGTDPWCKTSEGKTLLHIACINGRMEIAKYLVEMYPKMIHEVDNMKTTPAYYAAESGNVYVLSYLIDSGTYPWCRTSEGKTLLHGACIYGRLKITKYLVERYPKMCHAVDNMMRTPTHNAAFSGSISVLIYMIDRVKDPWRRTSGNETLLHRACINGQLEMTKYLVETYPRMLHEVDNSKSTPAHYAAQSGNVSVLIYLIDHGTNPWCKNFEQETLLHSACTKGQLEMIIYLVETYPKMLFEVDNNMNTPAYYAAQSGNVSALRYLIEHGTNPWCKNVEKETLLHSACIKGELEMTIYLTETYPKMLHEVDNMKNTPAYCAAESGNVSVLSYLIDSGTDPWCKNSGQETLLHGACISGQLEMTKFLVETYPNMLYQVDKSNRIPAYYAEKSGNAILLKYLQDRST